jgi:small GTP-binding protein
MERYNADNKIPKILHCGHTFCKDCLIKAKTNSNNILSCPICRKKELFESIEDLSTNRIIYDLLYNPTQEDDIIIDDKNKYKIIVIGSASTGKTSLVHRFVKKKFSEEYNVTLGADIEMVKMKIGDEYIGLNIWDTAGTEKFQSMQKMYYLKSYAAFVVFDVSFRETFESVPSWISFYKESKSKELKDIIYLIGNKIDIEENREVSKQEAEEFAKLHNIKYYEVSAKSGENIEKIFKDIGEELIRTYKFGNIYAINMGDNSPKVLDKNDLSDNKSCWDKLIESIKNIIAFWK